MQQYHNVSVRLNETDYKQLLFLHEKYNRMSYGKVSLADVLRIAVKELHLIESKDNTKPVTTAKTHEEQQQEVIQQLQEVQEEKETEQEKESK